MAMTWRFSATTLCQRPRCHLILVLERDFAVHVILSDRREACSELAEGSRNLLLLSVGRFLNSTLLRSVPLGMTSFVAAISNRAHCVVQNIFRDWKSRLLDLPAY